MERCGGKVERQVSRFPPDPVQGIFTFRGSLPETAVGHQKSQACWAISDWEMMRARLGALFGQTWSIKNCHRDLKQ